MKLVCECRLGGVVGRHESGNEFAASTEDGSLFSLSSFHSILHLLHDLPSRWLQSENV